MLFARPRKQRVAGPDVGILMGAARLAGERFSGALLKELTEEQRQDLYAEAKAIRERYLEQ